MPCYEGFQGFKSEDVSGGLFHPDMRGPGDMLMKAEDQRSQWCHHLLGRNAEKAEAGEYADGWPLDRGLLAQEPRGRREQVCLRWTGNIRVSIQQARQQRRAGAWE